MEGTYDVGDEPENAVLRRPPSNEQADGEQERARNDGRCGKVSEGRCGEGRERIPRRYSGFPTPPFFSLKYLYALSSIRELIWAESVRPKPCVAGGELRDYACGSDGTYEGDVVQADDADALVVDVGVDRGEGCQHHCRTVSVLATIRGGKNTYGRRCHTQTPSRHRRAG